MDGLLICFGFHRYSMVVVIIALKGMSKRNGSEKLPFLFSKEGKVDIANKQIEESASKTIQKRKTMLPY